MSGVLASTLATAPNAILVSPEWRQHLLRWEEGAENAASGSVTPPGTSNFSQSEGREGEESTQQIAQSGPVALQTDDSVCSAQGAQSAPGTVRAEEICAETGAQPDGDQLSVPWWRDHLPCDVVATLCSAGKVTKGEVVILAMEITGEHCEALLDSGESRSFISPNVTAYTDHQALTHMHNIRNNKPLRGHTARWLDFLAKFPHLTISYL